MKRYFLEFLANTPMSIGTRVDQQTKVPGHAYQMALRNAEVVVFDALHKPQDSAVRVSNGLGVHIYLDSPNPQDAVRVGREIAEVILTYLSFASSCACPPIRPQRLYDATSGVARRTYWQWFAYDVPGTIQQVDQHVAGELFKAVEVSGDPAAVRALALLRKGLSEDNYYDQFSAYWMTLEALNRNLKTLLPKRGVYKEGPYDRGIMRFFLQVLHWRHSAYMRLKRMRNGLFHGTQHHTRHFTRRIADYVPGMREAAVRALCLILGLPQSIVHSVTGQKVCFYQPLRGICEVLIELDDPPQLTAFGKQPFLEFPKPHLNLGINDDGSLHVELKQAVGSIEIQNAVRCDSNLRFSVDIGPRRKDLKGIHTKGDGTEEVLLP